MAPTIPRPMMSPRCLAAVAVSAVTLLPMLAATAAILAYDRVRSFARIAVVPDPELAEIMARIEQITQTRRINNGTQ